MSDPIREAAKDAERCLIGSMILDPSVIDSVSGIVIGAHFDDENLGLVFDHLSDRHAAQFQIVNTSVLVAELRKANLLDRIGGVSGIALLTKDAGIPTSACYHAQEVCRLHGLRSIRKTATAILDQTNDPSADPIEIASRMDSTLNTFTGEVDGVRSLSKMLSNLADHMEETREMGAFAGVETGISSIDLCTGGMLPGELIVIGARTSIGKTAFGMQVALEAAKQSHPVLIISLEMTELQLAQRVAASQLGLSLVNTRTGNYGEPEIQKVREYANYAELISYEVYPARNANMARIRGIARARKATNGLSLLLIDYLQLVTPSDPKRPRHEQVTQISHDLKSLAMELDIPVIALAQLNRQSESDESLPKLSHLRESGAIEQDADSVWFLHRGRDSNDAQLIIEKQRQGMRGTVRLCFDGPRCVFAETDWD